MFTQKMIELLLMGIVETLYMTFVSTVLAYVFGIPLGILLCVTEKGSILAMPKLNKILGFIVNVVRSVPFIILLIAVLPFTRFVVGTTIGSTATIVPLIIAAAPYIARLVESSLKEVDKGVIEAAQAMGSSPLQIIYKVLVPEAKPSLMLGAVIATTTILGYSTMAGFVGGGGLGAISTNYGYYRYQYDVMLVTIILLVIIVQVIQEVGLRIVKNHDKRIK